MRVHHIHFVIALKAIAAMAICAVGAMLLPSSAQALPAFARRYETSCGTCHTTFPKLNPFGEAFRRNGYRYPEGKDADVSMDEPVPMGHEVHKKLFPDQVWPGELPGDIPIGFVMQAQAAVTEGAPAHHHGAQPAVQTDDGMPGMGADDEDWGLAFQGSELSLVAGGVFGEHFSFFGKLEFNAEGELHLERPFLVIAPLDNPALMFKVGMFSPGLYPFSIHRSLTGHRLAFTTVSLGDNAWSPEPQHVGAEAYGVLFGRLGWSLGMVEGALLNDNEFNRAKDFYGRLEYKLGGLRLDGVGQSNSTRAWREWSVRLGASFYRGFATFRSPTGTIQGEQSDAFWRASVDVKAHLRDMTLTAAAYHQENQRPTFGNREGGKLDALVAEADYVVFPWLVPLARYELFRQELPGTGAVSGHRFLVGANALIRSNINIRLLAAGRRDGDEQEPRDFFEEVSLALSAGF